MGIGRRTFAKLVGLAVAGTLIDPFQAVVTSNRVYINKKLGILFNIPKNWGFVKVKEFGKLKEKQILDGVFEVIKEEVFEDLGDPICIVTKYFQDIPENKGLFSPTITLDMSYLEDVFNDKLKDMDELMHLSELGVSNILKEFKVIKRYDKYKICGCDTYERDSEYLFEHIDLNEPIKVELKSIKIVHSQFLYEFNFHQSKMQNQIAIEEFVDFKNSIKLI